MEVWDIFISDQEYEKAEFHRYVGNKDGCLKRVKELLYEHCIVEDDEFGINSIKVSENQIDYYGSSKIGANLILAAFIVE